MLAKNPAHRISSSDALNHPALTVVLSQSPLHVRSVFDNKELLHFSHITEQYDQKTINTKKQTKKSFGGVPDKIEDMSPIPMSPNKKKKSEANVQKLTGGGSKNEVTPRGTGSPNKKPNVFGAKE